MMIRSRQNNTIKQIRKLHTKKEREKTNTFLIEGYHLIEEALKSNWEVKHLIVKENIELPNLYTHLQTTYVSEDVFYYISQTDTPQGLLAIVQMKEVEIDNDEKVLLIDAVQDPGNLGTIIRTADAAGFNRVILGKGTVDLYNDKVIRATQGSLFHIKIEGAELSEVIDQLQNHDYTVYASALEDAKGYKDIDIPKKVALILGNEGAGISDTILEKANERIHIPIYGRAESLNVGIAAGILMYALIDE